MYGGSYRPELSYSLFWKIKQYEDTKSGTAILAVLSWEICLLTTGKIRVYHCLGFHIQDEELQESAWRFT